MEFGGKGGGLKAFNETWGFSKGNWRELFPAQNPDIFGVMAYDNSTQQVIKFGGDLVSYYRGHPSFTPTNETWGFSGGNWSELHPRHSPPAGLGFALVTYDPGVHGLLLYGSVPSRNGTWIWQVWEYASSNWSPVLIGSQLPRVFGMAYDPAYHGVVGVGQVSVTNSSFATWLWRNGSWTRLVTSNLPSAASFNGLQCVVYDSARKALLFASTGARVVSSKTWLLSNGHWRAALSAQVPRTRHYFGMTYDGTDTYVLLYGGNANYGLPFDQTWIFR
ncbi:MAG TPA: hypothetical protein VGV89_04195 [Thermoplasmata archaeon]|nr:hypothetical protein [Thermoplasmata archaeon]